MFADMRNIAELRSFFHCGTTEIQRRRFKGSPKTAQSFVNFTLAMNPISPFPAILALAVALLAAFFLSKRFGAPNIAGRFASIDGLRGYLAFFVFLHHSSTWYFFLRNDTWKVPPSNLYTHFGQSSITFFFMITGFLFWTKLIDGRKKQINWLRLYVSRMLRLTPMYFFMLMVLILLVAVLSNFVLKEPPFVFIKNIIRWSTFTILGTPDLNAISRTSIIIANVAWSLPYEWYFYLSLPLSAVFVRVIPQHLLLLIGATSVGALIYYNAAFLVLAAFGGGIAAAFLVRWKSFSSFMSGAFGATIALLCLFIEIAFFPTAYTAPAMFLLAVSFSIIASGNTLFGILSNQASRTLGEISYSIYLMHGIILFVVFRFIVGFPNGLSLSPVEHWLIILCCSAVLIPVCFITFHFIEAPAMRAVPGASLWIETRLTLLSRRRPGDGAPPSC